MFLARNSITMMYSYTSKMQLNIFLLFAETLRQYFSLPCWIWLFQNCSILDWQNCLENFEKPSKVEGKRHPCNFVYCWVSQIFVSVIFCRICSWSDVKLQMPHANLTHYSCQKQVIWFGVCHSELCQLRNTTIVVHEFGLKSNKFIWDYNGRSS